MIFQASQAILFYTFSILLVFYFILVCVIGIYLLIRGYQRNLNNIMIMGLAFLAMTLGFLAQFFIETHGFLIREILVLIGFIFFIIFTNSTFYKQHERNLGTYVLILGIAFAGIQLIFQILVDYILPDDRIIHYTKIALDLPFNLLVFNWMAFASFSAFKRIKNESIAPWIKTRYKFIALSSLIMSFHSIPEFFQPFEITIGDFTNLQSLIVFGIIALISLTFVILFGLAWIMPQWFKNHLNKNYEPIEEVSYSEKELMELIRNQISKRGLYGNN